MKTVERIAHVCTLLLLSRSGALLRIAGRRSSRGIVAVIVGALIHRWVVTKSRSHHGIHRALTVLNRLSVTAAVGLTMLGQTTSSAIMNESLRKKLLVSFLVCGMVPVITDAVRWDLRELITDGIFTSEADIPAVWAMILGLLLDHTDAASVILLMVTGGEVLEDYAIDRAGLSLHRLLEQTPPIAHRRNKSDDGTHDVHSEDLSVGDIILVRQNEVFPVDAMYLYPAQVEQEKKRDGVDDNFSNAIFGDAIINESLFTGEFIDAQKTVGSQIFGASINKGPAIWLKATTSYQDSVLSRMQLQLRNALEKKSSLELQSKQIADGLTPITIILATIAYWYSKNKYQSTRLAWETVLSVCMSSSPCPAAIGVPIAFLSGMSLSNSRLGATVKSGEAFESLASCTTIVLDKTGTVTQGRPKVRSFHYHFENEVEGEQHKKEAELSEKAVVHLITSLEIESNHILATAIREYALNSYPEIYSKLFPVKSVNMIQGQGIAGIVNQDFYVRIGTPSFCFEGEEGKKIIEKEDADHYCYIKTYFTIRTTKNIRIVGKISFVDELRLGAREFVQRLRTNFGLKVIMLSGDSSSHLDWIAKALGIDEYYRCLPHEKADRIQTMRKRGECVVMIGDGANDSSALATADLGISLDSSNLSSESASIVLSRPDLGKIESLLYLSRDVANII